MKKSSAVLLALFLLAAGPANAGQAMSGDEIRAAFTGNTIDGVWGDSKTPYRQYFEPGGATTYIENGGRASRGRWWAKDDAYCSTWPPTSAETCYEVRRDGDIILWVAPGSGALYPSTILPGNQLR